MALLSLSKNKSTCHGTVVEKIEGIKKIALVGSPNVGKSVIFGHLTGRYVTVSNYPGTTVEITRGKGIIGHEEVGIIDTPGMYSLVPITEEERIARAIIFEEKPDVVVQVIDAKNIQRMLHLTLQLMEAKVPVLLDLNLMDEAEKAGMSIDVDTLQKELRTPVVATIATENKGMDRLKENILKNEKGKGRDLVYAEPLESALRRI